MTSQNLVEAVEAVVEEEGVLLAAVDDVAITAPLPMEIDAVVAVDEAVVGEEEGLVDVVEDEAEVEVVVNPRKKLLLKNWMQKWIIITSMKES